LITWPIRKEQRRGDILDVTLDRPASSSTAEAETPTAPDPQMKTITDKQYYDI
jgi:hypothetical protein